MNILSLWLVDVVVKWPGTSIRVPGSLLKWLMLDPVWPRGVLPPAQFPPSSHSTWVTVPVGCEFRAARQPRHWWGKSPCGGCGLGADRQTDVDGDPDLCASNSRSTSGLFVYESKRSLCLHLFELRFCHLQMKHLMSPGCNPCFAGPMF